MRSTKAKNCLTIPTIGAAVKTTPPCEDLKASQHSFKKKHKRKGLNILTEVLDILTWMLNISPLCA